MNKIMQLYTDNQARVRHPLNLVKNGSDATLYIYDVIDADYGISAMSVIEAISQAAGSKTLNIRINSPGGSVFEARAIIEAIKRFDGETVAHIDSVAASAATGIAAAASKTLIAEGAFYMIHNASGIAFGDKNTMREVANLLEKVEGSLVADYTAKTGKDDQQIIDWMNNETWFTAAEAVAHGFADSIAETATKPKNVWNLSAFNHPPDELKKELIEPAPAGFFMSASNENALKLATSF